MHRFYIDHINGEIALLTDFAQLHHLKNVIRLKANDAVSVSDAAGNDYAGVIMAIGKKQAEIKVRKIMSTPETSPKLTVVCAIPKGVHLDEAIDHLTQLGVERIIPMQTERGVVKLDAARAEARLQRWRKIAQSAARQSQQARKTAIDPVTPFADVVHNAQNYDLKLIPHLTGERRTLREVLNAARPQNIIVLIGPEGDFTPEEVQLALNSGFIAVSLGATVLRVATAAVAAAAFIKLAADT
jgi:16S rRNA (uracil1498-N3)-methyltransferase